MGDPTHNHRSRVLVAVDGSDGALTALDWACGYAKLAGREVEAVHVWGYPNTGHRTSISAPYEALRAEAMETMRDQIARYTAEHQPTVGIHGRLVEGSVVEALVDESHNAHLLVIGRRGRLAFASTLLGSVSRGVVERVVCPVVVVHPHDKVG